MVRPFQIDRSDIALMPIKSMVNFPGNFRQRITKPDDPNKKRSPWWGSVLLFTNNMLIIPA